MERLFVIIFLIVLTSCEASLEPPKTNTDYKNIISKPVKIGNLEIAQYDFQKKMFWDDAKKACDSLGEGWRLPTKDELNILYENKEKIGGFSNSLYWSSTEHDNNGIAWFQFFNNGLQWSNYKLNILSVRAVRVK
jgi:hypothetical protein